MFDGRGEKLGLDLIFIRVGVRKPHSKMESYTVVHVQITMAKKELEYTTILWYGGSFTSTINLLTLPCESFVTQNYLASCTDIP